MTQEPPKRPHWERRTALEDVGYEKKPRVAPREQPAAAEQAPAPSPVVTAAITRPQMPVAQRLFVVEKVRLRASPGTDSAVLAMLAGGDAVAATDTDGRWRKVAVGGRVGWVHADYLSPIKPEVSPTPEASPTIAAVPPAPIPSTGGDATSPAERPAAQPVSAPASTIWSGLKPIRKPQISDCQCPYDLMLNGGQCGDRSAYARGRGVECYL